MSKSFSQIITAFTQANQQIELNLAKFQYDKMTQEIKDRRKKVMTQGVKKVDEAPVSASKSEKFKTMDEHKIPLPELEKRLETSLVNGMDSKTVERLTLLYGKNQLSEKKPVPWFVKIFHELTTVFSMMMWICAALCFIVFALSPSDPSNLYLAIVLCFIVLLTSIAAYFQNEKSEGIMAAFKNFIPPETIVIRDGQKAKLQATDLIPGDIVIVEFGKRIPADLRILESNEMKVDNSSLTGESLLLIRSIECTNPGNPLETKNLAFFGTLCKEGSGKGIVIGTGDRTVIGQIANLAASATSEESPLRREINLFIKFIAYIASFIGILFFCLGFVFGYGYINNLIFAIGILVANVPEGLITTVTIGLSLTAHKLAYRKVLVKNLESVETLGSTSCICSDKTGTLTQNKMTVEHLWFNSNKIKGHNRQKMGPRFQYQYDLNDQAFKVLHESAVICSEANFDPSLPSDQALKIQNNASLTEQQKEVKLKEAREAWAADLEKIPWLDRPTTGDASETALIKFFQPITDIQHTRNLFKLVKDSEGKPCKMPFNSTNKYAFLIVEQESPDSHYCLYTKGAPEKIWTLCDKIYEKGNVLYKDQEWEEKFEIVNKSFGKSGERVLGFARYQLPKQQYPKGFNFNIHQMNFPFQNQCFVGLISLIDPPKDAVPYAVIKCKAAGIKVIMVTGDQPVTAEAIAKQVNIITEKSVNEIAEDEGITFEQAMHRSNAIVIHGDRLTRMSIEEEGLPESEKGRQLNEWLQKSQIVFARTSPAQKLIIVDGCQKMGHIVAVTGDGVNDSPAIKKADIGISMGITGSDVAKDAADMILLDDDFSSIVIGIEEGRRIFDNLKKVIVYCVESNTAQLGPYLAFIILQVPLPLSTILVIAISIGTDIVPMNGFVFEEAELDIMTRRPRTQDEHLVTGKLLIFAYLQMGIINDFGAFVQYFIIFNDFGFPPNTLIMLNSYNGVKTDPNDIYNPNSPWLGNSLLKQQYLQDGYCDESNITYNLIDWQYQEDRLTDLRMSLVKCNQDKTRWIEMVEYGPCYINQISPISNRPVCYTTEALKYAQSGFFYSICWGQICAYISYYSQMIEYLGMKNYFMYFAFTTEFCLILCFAYILPLEWGIGTRDNIFQHFGMCGMPFALTIILWNEIRKYMIRNHPQTKRNFPNWWDRCVNF